jgi:glycosyltransferase involved in cell wall biosynthesis
MRLLFTATAYPPSTGGAQLHHHLLAQHLRQQHDVQVVCQWTTNRTDWLLGTTLRAPLKSQSYEIDGIEVHQLGLSMVERIRLLLPVIGYYPLMRFALPQITSCLKKHLRLHVDDVDLVHNVRFGREGLSYASYEFAQERNIPFVLTPVHHPRWIGWRYNAYIRLYQKADAVIALTNTEKRILVDLGVLPEKVYVTGVGPITAPTAHPERFLKNHNIDGPIVLFLGQHYAYKGYQQVIESAHLVWQNVPDAHFVFIGPGAGRSEQIFQALHDPRIRRLGKVDLQTKTDALAACSLLCVPSSQESFGGVYVEAWSMGKPVIGCKIPAVSEVITDEVDGYLVEQRSEQIADRIKFLLLNQTHAQNMGETGQTKVLEKYTWPKLATLTEQIYRKTIEAKVDANS